MPGPGPVVRPGSGRSAGSGLRRRALVTGGHHGHGSITLRHVDHETGPDTRPIGRVVPGRDPGQWGGWARAGPPAIPEPSRAAPGGSAPWPADLARPDPPEPAGPA